LVDGYTDEMLYQMQTAFQQKDNMGIDYNQMAVEDIDGNTYVLDSAERLNAYQFVKFKGWNCNAGYQSVVIRKEEMIRSFTCSCQALGTTSAFKLNTAPTECIMDQCVTSADTKIPRCKND
jgi:hypothetical protein